MDGLVRRRAAALSAMDEPRKGYASQQSLLRKCVPVLQLHRMPHHALGRGGIGLRSGHMVMDQDLVASALP